MNTVIPFIDASSSSNTQSIISWVIIGIFAAFALAFAILAIRKTDNLADKARSLGVIATMLGMTSATAWFAFGLLDDSNERKVVDASTIEQIEENLDVDLEFNDFFSPMIGCKDNLVDQTIDAVTAVRDSDRYLVSLTVTKNDDDETCTYEIKSYASADPILEPVDKK